VADLALTHQRTHGVDRLLERRRGIVEMQVVEIDVAGLQARKTLLRAAQEPAPADAAAIGAGWRQPRAHLGSDDPRIAVAPDGAADDLLRATPAVGVGRVDEVDAGLARLLRDAVGLGFVRLVAEHHRTEAERRNQEVALAEPAPPDLHAVASRGPGSRDGLRTPAALRAADRATCG
jgi:hypothetical protein